MTRGSTVTPWHLQLSHIGLLKINTQYKGHIQECLYCILKQSRLSVRAIVTIPLTFHRKEETSDGGWSDTVEHVPSMVEWFAGNRGLPYRYSDQTHTEAQKTSFLYEFGHITTNVLGGSSRVCVRHKPAPDRVGFGHHSTPRLNKGMCLSRSC